MGGTGAGMSSSAKVGVVAVAIAIGVVGVGYYASQQDKENVDTACHLAASGITALAVGMSHGQSTQEIIALSSGAISDFACREVVDLMIQSPSEPVTVVINTRDGETSVQLSGTQLTPVVLDVPSCDDWLVPTAEQMCRDGELGPPLPTP
jgi:superfamily II helicase